jgi:S1-C subfamily serine protease
MKNMNKILLILLFIGVSLFSNDTTKSSPAIKIFASISLSSYQHPWQTSRISKYTGSGAVIDGNKILTSAHVVSGASFIEVKKENDPDRYIAKLTHISHQSDLAILEVEDKDFFKGIVPFKINDNIKVRDKVTVLGYPIGGNIISITTGIVSRIEYRNYVWSKEKLLAIQIDAAINSGNSGGAVVNEDNELVGIAMMKLRRSSNIGYIVPIIVIKAFLKDIEDGVVNGFHRDNIYVQHLTNNSLKKIYGLGNKSGVLITHVDFDEEVLKTNDIILSIDDKNIANNGTIESKFGRMDFNLEFHKKQVGEKVKLHILRDKEEIIVYYDIKRDNKLIEYEFDKNPRYIIYGGFAFTPLTKNYLIEISSKNRKLKTFFYHKSRTKDYVEPVVCIPTIFPTVENRGYYLSNFILQKVNNIKIKDFKHLVSILDNTNNEFTIFEFLEKYKIVINTKKAKDSLNEVLKKYSISKDRRLTSQKKED